MPWVERPTSRKDGSLNAISMGETSVTFRVWDVAPEQLFINPAAIQNELGIGLPLRNSVHPSLPGFRLDQYTIGESSSHTFDAIAQYSNDGRYSMSEMVDPAREDFASWSTSTRSEDIKIPYAKQVESKVKVAEGPPPVFAYTYPYVADEWTTDFIMTRSTFRCNVDEFNAPMRRAIEMQVNKIHIFDGHPYLYKGGDVNQFSLRAWTVDHNWIHDGGNEESPFVGGQIPPMGQRYTGPLKIYTGRYPAHQGHRWTRPPYHKMFGPFPNENRNPEEPPLFAPVFEWEDDADGWRTLPGLTP